MTADQFVIQRREVYKRTPSGELTANLYLPGDWSQSDSRTCIVFFGGGAWMAQNPDQFMRQAIDLARHGVVAVTAQYRTRNQNGTTPVESVKDAKSAVRWSRAMASSLGLDPCRIIASGGSAGGHIAACTGTVPGLDEEGDLGSSSVPNGLVLFNPVLDLTAADLSPRARRMFEELGIGHCLGEISPTRYVRPGTPPTVIFHGTADTTVPFSQAQAFSERMRSAGNRCDLHPAEGQGHGFFNHRSSLALNEGKWYMYCLDRTREFVLSYRRS